MKTESILEVAESSFLIIEERERKDIVIGVPHHAPAGVSELPCPEHRVADENTGFIGIELARKLNCCSIIASNYTIDANKSDDSDYTRQINNWAPKVLVEIHGHGPRNARFDIEISSGSKAREMYAKALAQTLHSRIQIHPILQILSVSGDYSSIYFKASQTVTISNNNRIAYHIELPSVVRKPESKDTVRPGKTGLQFSNILAESIQFLHE